MWSQLKTVSILSWPCLAPTSFSAKSGTGDSHFYRFPWSKVLASLAIAQRMYLQVQLERESRRHSGKTDSETARGESGAHALRAVFRNCPVSSPRSGGWS